jgi:chaperonin cofactor prefoldin
VKFNIFENLFKLYDMTEYDYSVMSKMEELENRVKVLEEENVSLTNELYRLENSLDARIDILSEHLGVNYVRTPNDV